MEIFEPQSYPADQRLLVGWGNGNLEILLSHYGSPLENQTRIQFDSLVSADACRGEFLPFKCLVHHHLVKTAETMMEEWNTGTTSHPWN